MCVLNVMGVSVLLLLYFVYPLSVLTVCDARDCHLISGLVLCVSFLVVGFIIVVAVVSPFIRINVRPKVPILAPCATMPI